MIQHAVVDLIFIITVKRQRGDTCVSPFSGEVMAARIPHLFYCTGTRELICAHVWPQIFSATVFISLRLLWGSGVRGMSLFFPFLFKSVCVFLCDV